MLKALVRTHLQDKEARSMKGGKEGEKPHLHDLVRGKGLCSRSVVASFILTLEVGQGLVVLLHGVPGVGKTSTAGQSISRKHH